MTLTLLTDISQLALPHLQEGESRTPVDIIEDAAILIKNDEILARGPRLDIEAQAPSEASRVSCSGRAVIPGLVDSHTHAVFAGQRVDEFLRRGRASRTKQLPQQAAAFAIRRKHLLKATSKKLFEHQRNVSTECSTSERQPWRSKLGTV